jgi:hypothetical protein
MPEKDHVAIYFKLEEMFEKLFDFEHVGILFYDLKKDQLYLMNAGNLTK